MKKLIVLNLIVILILTGCNKYSTTRNKDKSNELVIVTSFYPIYIATLNIADNISGVKVVNLTKPITGCLHDYQVSPADMKTLEKASIFVINGAGMESFMDDVIKQLPDIKTIEASKDIHLIKSDINHTHNDAEHNEIEEHNNHDSEEYNPHVWVSVTNAIKQVDNIAEQLAELDPKNKEQYIANANSYKEKLEQLRTKMHEGLNDISNKNIITFHEAFPYFAEEFGFNIVDVVEREPGSEPSATELAQTIEKVKSANVKALFAEPQYSTKAANVIANETGRKVYILDPVVTGDMNKDSYITAMEKNLDVLMEALK